MNIHGAFRPPRTFAFSLSHHQALPLQSHTRKALIVVVVMTMSLVVMFMMLGFVLFLLLVLF